jgi:hypothetical protein
VWLVYSSAISIDRSVGFTHGHVGMGAWTGRDSPCLEPEHFIAHCDEWFPGWRQFDGMSAALLWDIEMTQYLAALWIELDYPARRTWRLIEWPHAGPQRSIHQFERIDPSKMINFAEEVAIEVELLNAAIFPVSHVDYPLTVDLDCMWKVEISGGCARLAPLLHPFAFFCIFENSGITVPIGNEDASVRSKSDIGSSVEWAAVVRLLAYSDGHELFAQRRILDND